MPRQANANKVIDLKRLWDIYFRRFNKIKRVAMTIYSWYMLVRSYKNEK